MNAVNLLNPLKIVSVFKYEDCYVRETEQVLKYQVLSKTDLRRGEIDRWHLYSHYDIEGVIYESTWTNDYKAIIPKSKGYEQLKLF